MKPKASKHDIVKLLRDVRGHRGDNEVELVRGMFGVVVDEYLDGDVEVEFIREGDTVGFAKLHPEDVELRLWDRRMP